ncbi:MAG: DUF1573 domain-containing protein [Bacteroidales bacterium]|nr:DUF1573 domain-containing protein [Bacteroidales bacterium]
MRLFGLILAYGLAMTAGVTASGQLRIIPREKVESVADPRLSEESSFMRFDTRHIVAEPMNEADSPKCFVYRFENTGSESLKGIRIVTTCSCMTATVSAKEILPGQKGEIQLMYNPKGHPGRFERKVFVYTEAHEDPAAVLRLSVEVNNGADMSLDWPIQMGTIRLRNDVVEFRSGVRAVERLCFINLGAKDLKLECETSFLPQSLTFRCDPEIVQPGQEGQIVIKYDPSAEGAERNAVVILKGLGVPPSRSSVKVVINDAKQ